MARGLALFLLSLLVLFAAYSATFSFVAIRIDELGGGLFVIGVAAGLQAVAETPVMRASPWLGRLLSDRAWYVIGALVLAASFAAWAFLDEPVAIALVKLLVGVGFALAYVGSVLIVDDLVPEALRSTGQGLARAVCFGLAPILGSLVGGVVYDVGGPAALFIGCGVAAVAAGAGAALVGGARAAVAPGPALDGRDGSASMPAFSRDSARPGARSATKTAPSRSAAAPAIRAAPKPSMYAACAWPISAWPAWPELCADVLRARRATPSRARVRRRGGAASRR